MTALIRTRAKMLLSQVDNGASTLSKDICEEFVE
jgi:hypothetical protein